MADVVRSTIEDIERRRADPGLAVRTPMEGARWLSALTGSPVLLKCENLQRTGSFKIRGAYTRMSHLTEEERARGVVAASAGNHAQGVALAAQALGIKATVFMPEGAPIPKEKATRGLRRRRGLPRALPRGLPGRGPRVQEATGAVLIHPFDYAEIVAGQGTVGLEILEQAPEVETVVVPCGGGGLLAGIAMAVKAKRPEVRLIGVQAEGAAAFPASLEAGHPVKLRVDVDDGRRHRGRPAGRGDVRRRPRPRRRDRHGVRGRRCHAPCWPPGAGEAGGRAGGSRGRRGDPRRPGPLLDARRSRVLSGGNIDPLLLGKVIQHGMAAGGRYLDLSAPDPRPPGRSPPC